MHQLIQLNNTAKDEILMTSSKIITLFNHKGGVSKITTTYNIAWKLAEEGHRVLLVDGDTQCNLSYLLMGDKFEDYYEEDQTKDQNIYNAVKVAFEGKPAPIERISCFQPTQNKNLFLIPGHPNLSEYEPVLGLSLSSNKTMTTLQNLPGAFLKLITLCQKEYDIEYTFIDLNPGLSAMNQILFSVSDYFIVPINPDPFSLMAMKTLMTILPRWINQYQEIAKNCEEAAYPLPFKHTTFIGSVVQRFSIRNASPTKPFQKRIDEINDFIKNNFVPKLSKAKMIYDLNPFMKEIALNNYCLAEIPEFGSLLQKSHDAQVPVFALNGEQIKEQGNVRSQLEAKRDSINEIFESVAKIIEMLQND
eukprot:TRINITY_DN5370_c0_g1_i4.p1 TRINITY_DN5370_c0_g1~~TRINITY_DN5370_c0_g1_i4.p1  ORF type:complete len:362 (-),score=34.46 TRINITY_DN5370_c0_g1_i4:308-1393(-)